MAQRIEQSFIPPELKGKKLYCRVWSDTGENGTPQVLARKTLKYGTPEFHVKIGGKDRVYKINYISRGIIKQDSKKLIYDVHFLNTVGGLSFHEFPEDMDSEEAYTVFKNNAVNMYVKKGGIPMWYLLIAMGVALVGFIAIIAVVPSALQAQDEVKQLDALVTQLKGQNAVLQAQNEQLRSNSIG